MSENMEDSDTTIQQVTDQTNSRNNRSSIMPTFSAFSEKLASSRYLKWAVLALLPVLILLRNPVEQLDTDLWWQMALGKYYLTHHTLIADHSIFSWTPTDPTWIYNTCLGSIAFYLVYTFMGGFGLWTLQWLIFLGVFLSFYLFLRMISQKLDVTSVTIIAAVGIVCSLACCFYKPEIFSALMFCWTVFIFFCAKLTHRVFLFYLYPLIFALWVNLHGAFVFGLIFLVLVFTGELLNRIFFSKESFTTKDLIHLGAACVLSLAATLINPYGIHYLLSTYNGLTSDAYMSLINKYILAYLSLWQYLKEFGDTFFRLGQTAWIMTIMIFFMGCLFLYEFIKKKSFDFTLLIVNVALYWKGMDTSRASYFFPLAFFFSFFYLLHRLKLKSILGKTTILSLVVLLFFFANISYSNIRYGAGFTWFGTGLDNFVPVKEVSFLKKYHPEGPIFNDYVIGGYLTWDLYPDYKVFIDPRCSPFRNQTFPDYMAFTNVRVTGKDIERFREKYPFKIAILHYRQIVLIYDFLRAGGDWRLLYFDQNAAVLMHKSLLPTISPEMGAVDLSPVRFRNVTNPQVLLNIFHFYLNLDPKAAQFIYDIYKINVSNYYKLKKEHLQGMNLLIRLKELEAKVMKKNFTVSVPHTCTVPIKGNVESVRNDISKTLPTI
ncbi:hypothetical protein ASZ90_005596 [hydrocarbon metagenome]|uniref:Glycosyltransferase RgtA/B/C/D-like domain-containing protein n=1 Tax=hydrocarbon metagenome TaxID=938273 RepID=A0A0W8FUP8_9ZZZZ